VGYRFAVAVLGLAVLAGCTSAQQRAIQRAFAPPPVDLRAVPNGIEVRFVCGPAIPFMSTLSPFRATTSTNGKNSDTWKTYPVHARPVSSVILAIPAAERHVRLSGSVFVRGPAGPVPHVPFGAYPLDFRQATLPTNSWHRIPGNDCGHDTSATAN
jgi:hypothetical protein